MIECYQCKRQMTTFYSALNNLGAWVLYCQDCYSKNFLDNFENINVSEATNMKCECGTKAPISQHHSNWCDLYKREF